MVLKKSTAIDGKASIIDGIFSAFVALIPFLHQYGTPFSGVRFLDMVFALFFFYYIAKGDLFKERPKGAYRGYYIYIAIILFLSFIVAFCKWFDFYRFAVAAFHIVFYAAVVFVAYERFSTKIAMRVAVPLSVVFGSYLIIQWLAKTIFGIYLPTSLFPDFIYGSELHGFRLDYISYYERFMFRPSSLFLEPAHFSYFVAVPLAYMLGVMRTNWKTIIGAMIITVALVLSTSSSGLLVLVICWAFFFSKSMSKNDCGKTVVNPLVILGGILLIAAVIGLLMSPLSADLFARALDGGSVSTRIIRGFLIFSQMGTFEQLFGVGINNLTSYIECFGVYTPYDEAILEYLSGFNSCFVYSGIFGLLAFLFFAFSLLRGSKTPFSKITWLIFMVIFFYASIQFTLLFSYFVIVQIALLRDESLSERIVSLE